MEINVTVEGIDGIDMKTVIGETRAWDDEHDAYRTKELTIGEVVAARVTAELTKDESYPGLRKQFLAIRDEEIREAVKPIVEQVILAPVQRTNEYGEATGETTTLRALVVAETKKVLALKADSYGRGSETVLQKFVRDEISAAFKKELAEVLAEEKAKVVAAVRAKAADLIADAVKQGIGR